MLFRPTYCANCGEKIERAEWHLWTSRRFCELCATEFRGIDLLPKVAVATGILGIVLAVSGYVGRGTTQTAQTAAKPAVSLVQQPPAKTTDPVSPRVEAPPVAPNRTENVVSAPAGKQVLTQGVPAAAPEKTEGPIYFCGAQTKKGTPCSRRVKGNVRCFQHTGMPAMLPPEKLRVG